MKLDLRFIPMIEKYFSDAENAPYVFDMSFLNKQITHSKLNISLAMPIILQVYLLMMSYRESLLLYVDTPAGIFDLKDFSVGFKTTKNSACTVQKVNQVTNSKVLTTILIDCIKRDFETDSLYFDTEFIMSNQFYSSLCDVLFYEGLHKLHKNDIYNKQNEFYIFLLSFIFDIERLLLKYTNANTDTKQWLKDLLLGKLDASNYLLKYTSIIHNLTDKRFLQLQQLVSYYFNKVITGSVKIQQPFQVISEITANYF